MDNSQKFIVAVRTLKSDAEFITNEDITSQTTFNTVSWVTGTDEMDQLSQQLAVLIVK